MPSRRLVFFIDQLDDSTAAHQLAGLAEGFAARHWQIGVICATRPRQPSISARLDRTDVEFMVLNTSGTSTLQMILRLTRQLRQWNPTILHSHGTRANLLARFARLLFPLKVLVNSSYDIQHRSWWQALPYRLTDGLCSLNTNTSRAGAKAHVKAGCMAEHKMSCLPIGTTTTPVLPTPEEQVEARVAQGLDQRFAWLTACSPASADDCLTVLQAFSRALRNEMAAVLLICGEAPAQLREQVRQLGIEQAVRFTTANFAELARAADGFACASAQETAQMLLLRASAFGLPVVASDKGGIRGLVVHRETGFVVPTRHAEPLAASMKRLMSLPLQERKEMGSAGHHHVMRRHRMTDVVDKWEALYVELLIRSGECMTADP